MTWSTSNQPAVQGQGPRLFPGVGHQTVFRGRASDCVLEWARDCVYRQVTRLCLGMGIRLSLVQGQGTRLFLGAGHQTVSWVGHQTVSWHWARDCDHRQGTRLSCDGHQTESGPGAGHQIVPRASSSLGLCAANKNVPYIVRASDCRIV